MTDGHAATSLADLCAALAEDLDGVELEHGRDATEYRRAGRPFAIVSGDVIEIHLDPDVAEAAARVPDTSPSSRGPGWVRIAPPAIDRFVSDRVEAWFLSAWRLAEG